MTEDDVDCTGTYEGQANLAAVGRQRLSGTPPPVSAKKRLEDAEKKEQEPLKKSKERKVAASPRHKATLF